MLTAPPADRLPFEDSSVTEAPRLTARFLRLRGDAVKHSENLCRGADLKLCPTAVWRVRSRVSTTAQTEKTTTGTFFWAPLAFKQRQRTNVTRGIFISYKDLSRRRFSLLTILQHIEMGGGVKMRACVEWSAKQARSSSYLNCFALKRKLEEKPSMTSQKLKKKSQYLSHLLWEWINPSGDVLVWKLQIAQTAEWAALILGFYKATAAVSLKQYLTLLIFPQCNIILGNPGTWHLGGWHLARGVQGYLCKLFKCHFAIFL